MHNVTIFGEHDEATRKQILAVMDSGAEHFVECADGHLGYGHPIGGVAAYRDHISLSGVGFDIGCGNGAVATDLPGDLLLGKIDEVMDAIVDKVSFGMGRSNRSGDVGSYFDIIREHPAWKLPHVGRLKALAYDQLGTVGSGNHYVDLMVDRETGCVWIGVHFGSRGLGHKIATHYMKEVGAKDDMMSSPALIEADSALGREYLSAMELAGIYAHLGRRWVLDAVFFLLCDAFRGIHDVGTAHADVENHHNFCWREEHFGEPFWVVRKGATPAFPGQLGFIGGSMGDDAVIVRGVDSEASKKALYSTVHGAGRVMSRTAARGKFVKDPATGKKIRQQGLVRHDEWMAWLVDRQVTLRGGDLDEAPQAYRRLDQVLQHHAGTIEILHRLKPVGVAMAGSDVADHYKD